MAGLNARTSSVGIIGLGMIGGGVARALADKDVTLRGYDIRAEAFERLPDDLERAATPASAAESVDVALIAVMDDAQVRDVLASDDGILAARRPPAVVVVLSTVTLETIRWAAHAGTSRGVAVLDCGVSGGPEALAHAAITAMVGGETAAIDAARPVLEGFADPVVHCGALGNGMRAKLARNLITFAEWMVAWEAAHLALAAGVPQERFVECVRSSDRWMQGHMFLVENGIGSGLGGTGAASIGEAVATYAEKDLRAARALGEELGLTLPATELALRCVQAMTGLNRSDGTGG